MGFIVSKNYNQSQELHIGQPLLHTLPTYTLAMTKIKLLTKNLFYCYSFEAFTIETKKFV